MPFTDLTDRYNSIWRIEPEPRCTGSSIILSGENSCRPMVTSWLQRGCNRPAFDLVLENTEYDTVALVANRLHRFPSSSIRSLRTAPGEHSATLHGGRDEKRVTSNRQSSAEIFISIAQSVIIQANPGDEAG